MKNKLKFNRFNIPEEMGEINQVIDYFSGIMQKAKKEWIISQRQLEEATSFIGRKEAQRIALSKSYNAIMEENPKLADAKAKQLAYSDADYINFIENEKKELTKLINDFAEKDRAYEDAKKDYYTACNKRALISDGIKMLIGGFFEVNEEKCKQEVKELKKKKRTLNVKKK